MERTNKYTSLNFNDIYEKKATTNSTPSGRLNSSSSSLSSSPGSNKTILFNSRIHGPILLLSRPTPKPISIPIQQQQQQKLKSPTEQIRTESNSDSDSISLRPQGRTTVSGSTNATTLSSVNQPSSPLQSPLQKSNRFVPPHLRPGFVGREEKPVPVQGVRARPEPHQGSPNRYGENSRPKSGGGCERMRRGFSEADSVNFVNRPSSSGARPSSSG